MSLRIIFLFLIVNFQLLAQNATVTTPNELKREAQKVAKEQILLLSKSVILFRLDSKSEQIAYYEKYNNIEAANKLKAETIKYNLRIIDAFRINFSFCPVFFFDDSYSATLSNKQLDSIVFYNDALIPDAQLKIPIGTSYFIAEYGVTRDDDDNKFRSNYYIDSDTSGVTQKTRYYDDGNLGLSAFVLMDLNFIQLQRPFPYYARFTSLRSPAERLNAKIKSWSNEFDSFLKSNPE